MIVFLITLIIWPSIAFANSVDGFPDVPYWHRAYNAIGYLQRESIIQGKNDGTFQPDALATRAEALTLIARSLLPEEHWHIYTTVPWNDVQQNDWFRPFLAYAYEKGIVDGPEKGRINFDPYSPIRRAELWKMIFLLYGEDPHQYYHEIQTRLGSDVANNQEWYYPFTRYAVATSMAQSDEAGRLTPGSHLTRGDIAIELSRFLRYRLGKRQEALLTKTLVDLRTVEQALAVKQWNKALEASARAMLTSRGALNRETDNADLRAMVKITEAYFYLVLGRIEGGNHFYTARQRKNKAKAFAPDNPDVVLHAAYVELWVN